MPQRKLFKEGAIQSVNLEYKKVGASDLSISFEREKLKKKGKLEN